MTVQCVKGNDGRWWWVHRESMPSPLVAKELLPHGGSVSKLRSGEDWSWPREGGQGRERDHSRNMQRHGSDGTFRNIWGDCVLLKVELTPCLILCVSECSWMKFPFLEPRFNSGLLHTPQKCCVEGGGLFWVILGDQQLRWVRGDCSI